MTKWKRCRKKPVEVEFREVRQGEDGVETLEGYKVAIGDTHFIIRGVRGEEYPIRKDIFYETYEVIE